MNKTNLSVFLLLWLTVVPAICWAQSESIFLNVRLEEAGGLRDAIGERLMDVDSLVVAGPINKADFLAMSEAIKTGHLRYVDLAEALPEGRCIPDSVFDGGSYYYVYQDFILPVSLDRIGVYAFGGLYLRNLTLPLSLKSIGENAFRTSGGLNMEKLEFPDDIEVIEKKAFYKTGDYTSAPLCLPASLREIGDSAFYKCGCGNVIFPEGLTTLGSGVFALNHFEEVTLPSTCLNLEGEGHFMDSEKLVSMTLPDGLTALPSRFLGVCRLLRNLYIPSTVESIGDYFITINTSMEHLSLPEGVRSIGSGAFLYMKALRKVYLPSTLQHIGPDGIDCSNVEALYCAAPLPPEWEVMTPGYFPKTTVYVLRGSKEAYLNASGGWDAFDNFVEIDPLTMSALDEIITDEADAADDSQLYDLSGRPVAEPRTDQIYVSKGRKFINHSF